MIVVAVAPPVIALAWWYGKFIIALLVVTLLVGPSLFFDIPMFVYYSYRALCHLIGRSPRDKGKESD